ncbi:hypothetical protein JCM16303_007305 [Sporobolomyces ruberrimus]
MLSSTILSIATSIFTLSASAAPLQIRCEGADEYSSPRINGNLSTGITWATYTGSGWKWIANGEGSNGGYPTDTVIFDYRGYVPTPPHLNYTISQWYGANDQYRIGVGAINAVETCLGGSDDRISGFDCDSPLAAWTISCLSRDTDNGPVRGNCRFEATQSGGCATFTDFDTPMNLTDCSPIDDGDIYNPQNNPQQFYFRE